MKRILLAILMLGLAGCDSGVQHMGPTEYGVRFRNLPRFLGSGVGGPSSVASPLETVLVMPWEKIYRYDTSPQYLLWKRGIGAQSQYSANVNAVPEDDVHTRARAVK